MVRTVNPKAKATPANPIPRFGNAADRTALPQPPKTSQNVPRNSAPVLLPKGMTAPFPRTDYHESRRSPQTEAAGQENLVILVGEHFMLESVLAERIRT